MRPQEIVIEKNGPPEVLTLRDQAPLPQVLAAKSLLIDVHYSGINFADIFMRLGFYPDAPPKPFIPGYEVSGVVAQVGPESQFKLGDRVMAGTRFGGYRSHVQCQDSEVFLIPEHLSLAEAAGLMVNWVTAAIALMDMGRVRSGDKVLVDSASGGVGTLSLQILRSLGVQVTGLTTSSHKLAYIQEQGGPDCTAMNYSDWVKNSEGERYDIILNSLGGKSIREQWKRLALGGRMICYGLASGITPSGRGLIQKTMGLAHMTSAYLSMPSFKVGELFDSNKGIFGLNVLYFFQDPQWVSTFKANLNPQTLSKIRPVIDRVFAAKDIAAAHHYIEEKRHRGKVLIAWKNEIS